MIWAVLLSIPAYLFGNIPFAVLVARMAGHDIYSKGSKNPGASNVARIAGWRWGSLAMALDILKGFIPTVLALTLLDSYLTNEQTRVVAYLVGCAAMLGHVLPIGRKGGKGIATGAGAIIALLPFAGLAALVAWVLVMKISKLPVVSSICASVILPIWVGIDHNYLWEFVLVTLLFAFVVLRHIPNLRRLIKSEETGVSKTLREQYKHEKDIEAKWLNE